MKLLSALFSPSLADIQQRHQQYLSEAVDMHDLEVRMRQLDEGQRSFYPVASHGVFVR
ncbi:MAG TPA: DUF3563 family protein [Rubrivivax sp.]|nr:DUF3563 family protein [Rubrivivax sp.]